MTDTPQASQRLFLQLIELGFYVHSSYVEAAYICIYLLIKVTPKINCLERESNRFLNQIVLYNSM